MAITRASDLAAVGSGLGANPAQPINIGAAVTISGSAGVITATTFSGNATGLGGEPSIVVDSVRASDESTFLGGLKVTGVTTSSQGFSGNITGTAATFSGNVIVGGVLTYEDVTNIDSIGIITARSDVSIADKIIHTGDTNTAIRFPASDTFTAETAGSERLRIAANGNIGINSTNPSYLLDIASGSASMRLNSTSTSTLVITSGAANAARIEFGDLANNDTGYIYYDNSDDSMQFATNGSTERLRITSGGDLQVAAGGDLEMASNGRIFVGNGGNATNPMFANVSDTNTGITFPAADTMMFTTGGTEKLSIDSNGSFLFNNGALVENVEVVSGKLSDNTDIDLEDGMVYLFTTAETTTSIPNIRINSSTTLESVMGNGKAISVTIMTTAAAAGYFTTAKIDGNANGENSYTLNVDWLGGSAPSEGGSSGIDAYNITIIKQSTKNFNILIAQNNYA